MARRQASRLGSWWSRTGTAPRRLVSLLLGLAFILVVGFFMTQMRGGEAPPALVWAMLGVAGALLAWRLWLSR